jgi:hypothetical protein
MELENMTALAVTALDPEDGLVFAASVLKRANHCGLVPTAQATRRARLGASDLPQLTGT